ncbi:MAG: response regulator transcription factor [Acidimicrobiales bacterium]|nr:response regulator transcription factor [Acidimicrobiales bacterium]
MQVLVVEDDPTVARGVARCLTTEGFSVDTVDDGAEGLSRARSGRYDLIVLDLMLPTMNGFRVCRALREADDWTPILMLTAKSGEYDEAEGLDTGADDFLTKPFSTVVLQARVHALLRRPRRRVDWPAVGDLRLDPIRRRCYRGDVGVELTNREMEVLALLMDHADHTVTKAEILERVWGPSFAGDENIVEVYVGHLRQKLADPVGQCSIVTVRGEGYRLRTDAVEP